jgi:hypothetical protein
LYTKFGLTVSTRMIGDVVLLSQKQDSCFPIEITKGMTAVFTQQRLKIVQSLGTGRSLTCKSVRNAYDLAFVTLLMLQFSRL